MLNFEKFVICRKRSDSSTFFIENEVNFLNRSFITFLAAPDCARDVADRHYLAYFSGFIANFERLIKKSVFLKVMFKLKPISLKLLTLRLIG